MVKLIDAKENLSIQVHPDDDYALSRENQYGKNEMWYVLEHKEGADGDLLRLQAGYDTGTGAGGAYGRLDFVAAKLDSGRERESLYIPAGTVHAIGRGGIVCEIQQSSNCTYRLYDYNRTDRYGNRRQLHVEKALEVMDYHRYELPQFQDETVVKDTYTCRILSRCKYFEQAGLSDSRYGRAACLFRLLQQSCMCQRKRNPVQAG